MSKPTKLLSYVHTAAGMQCMFLELDDSITRHPKPIVDDQFFRIGVRLHRVLKEELNEHIRSDKKTKSSMSHKS